MVLLATRSIILQRMCGSFSRRLVTDVNALYAERAWSVGVEMYTSVIVRGSFSCFHGFFHFLLFSRSQETLEPETWIPLAFVLLAITFITYLLDCV
jgi:hypothetical protein